MRKSGVLLPIFSLPGKYGIGCFSKEAYRFIDFLASSRQTYWQILPLGVTSYGDSPYQSFSAFAGNPYFISLDPHHRRYPYALAFYIFRRFLNGLYPLSEAMQTVD